MSSPAASGPIWSYPHDFLKCRPDFHAVLHSRQLRLGYSVDVASRTIIVRTEKREHGRATEHTNIRFDGVLGYLFRDSLGGILNDVYPLDWATLRRDYAAVLDSWDKWAWPFQGCRGDPAEHAKAAGATAFQIDSAIGFDGFVVCQTMTIEAAPQGHAAGRPQSPGG